ncbi:hypothetical protein ACJZ2D_009147 [Fusarium nematophilum]
MPSWLTWGGWAIDFDDNYLETSPPTAPTSSVPDTRGEVETQPQGETYPTQTDESKMPEDEEETTRVGVREISSVNATAPNATPPPCSPSLVPRQLETQTTLRNKLGVTGALTTQIKFELRKAIETVTADSLGYHMPQSFFENLMVLSGKHLDADEEAAYTTAGPEPFFFA